MILLKNDPILGLANGSRGVVVGLNLRDPTQEESAFNVVRPQVRFDTGQVATLAEESFFAGSSSHSITRRQVRKRPSRPRLLPERVSRNSDPAQARLGAHHT